MSRSIVSCSILTAAFSVAMVCGSVARGQDTDSGQHKNLDIQSPVGDLHVGSDADARKAGLPLYPGARVRHDEENSTGANLGLFTEAFGVKLVVAKYDSDDAPAKVIEFYRERLKKYGKVLECHTHEHGGAHADIDDDKASKELKCEGDNSGPITELKVGTEDNQHVVAVEAKDAGKGSTFALVYVHTRGKQGDI
jgi:hypothetical protein